MATNPSDALVKLLIQCSESPLLQWQLGPVAEWLNVDLPRTQNRRVDLLGRMSDRRLLHIELQSTNDHSMPFRMAEYALAITRRYGQYPVQLLIYVGNAKLRMKPEFRAEGMVCWYSLADVRSLNATALLKSNRIEDNILAVLAGLENSVEGVRMILARIAQLKEPRRGEAMQHLLLTCGVRGLADVCEKELRTMPIAMNALDHDPLFASYIRRGKLEGEKEGLKKGLKEGQMRGFSLVQLQLEKRFGPLSPAIAKRLDKLSEAKTRELALAIVDANSLDELFSTSRH